MDPEDAMQSSDDEKKPMGHPMEADEFAHALGFSDADIAEADARVRERFPELFANLPE
jgi:hypothetical protein